MTAITPASASLEVPRECIEGLVDLFTQLEPQNLGALSNFYGDEVVFRDPFNEVRGLPAMRHIFAEMFEQLIEPKFTVKHWAGQGRIIYLAWDFNFAVRIMGRVRTQCIEGLSECRWALSEQGEWRIVTHLDHWDSATQVYAQLPLVGAIVRWFRRRLSAG